LQVDEEEEPHLLQEELELDEELDELEQLELDELEEDELNALLQLLKLGS
jgi:hypothetical protein